MRENHTLIEDLIALGGNVFGNLAGARHEMKAQAREHMGSLARHLDLISREEFDAAFAMLTKARTMQEELAERLAKVEARLNLSRKSGTSEIKSSAKRNLPSIKKRKRGRN